MKPELQRVAIAEACGWKMTITGGLMWHEGKKLGRIVPGTGVHMTRLRMKLPMENAMIPDFLNDLNVMHEAEKVLTMAQWQPYMDHLFDICDIGPNQLDFSYWNQVHAKASDRAEAFLRTLNLWKDET